MELRTFNSAADVLGYISALVDEGLAYHFDDDPSTTTRSLVLLTLTLCKCVITAKSIALTRSRY